MTGLQVAMVLAAGRGERMRPLSEVLPKPALPLADGPVVGSAIRLAASAGAGRVVVNTWHLGRRMQEAVAEVADVAVPVEVSAEDTLMGTAGGLAVARDRGLLGSAGPVLIINGDGIHDLDLGKLLERHASGRDSITLALLPHPDPCRWSRVLVDDGAVTSIRAAGNPRAGEEPLLYPGVMLVSREILDGLPSTPGETPERLWYPALAEGRLGGAAISGKWREVGTPDDYRTVVSEQMNGRVSIHADARVATGARIESSLVGRGVRIGGGSVIRNSVLAEGVEVAQGAVITDSIVFGAIRVRAGEEIRDEVRTGSPQSR